MLALQKHLNLRMKTMFLIFVIFVIDDTMQSPKSVIASTMLVEWLKLILSNKKVSSYCITLKNYIHY